MDSFALIFYNGSEHNSTDPSLRVDVVVWFALDLVLLLAILCGNTLTLCAIRFSRKISVLVSNMFIFNLALSDLLVGFSLPYHLVFYIDPNWLGANETTCVVRFVLIILACSCSILNLLAIAADRYVAIVHPLRYARVMTRRLAGFIIVFSWLICFATASVPIYWNDWVHGATCTIEVLPRQYLNLIVTPMFCSIWIAMYIVYFRIWREASGHARRLRQVASNQSEPSISDSKSVQVVLLILGCFSICWLPYIVVVTYVRTSGVFTPVLYEAAFTMAATNSCMNPIIYAWKNTNFRQAFWCLLRCKPVNLSSQEAGFITNHVPSTNKSLTNGSLQTTDLEMTRYEEENKDKIKDIKCTDLQIISSA